MLNNLQNKENDKIDVIQNFVNVDYKMNKDDLINKHKLQNKIIIGYIGTLAAHENIENILKCIKSLNNDKIMMIMIGDGPHKNAILDFIKINNLSENVLYLGRLRHELAIEYYQVFDLCIFPKQKCELNEVKSSFKLIEAMLFGKAVIVSNLKASNEIIADGENGMLCIPDNVNDLLDKMKMLISNDDMRESLGYNAKEWIKKNRNWNNICDKLRNTYDELLDDENGEHRCDIDDNDYDDLGDTEENI